MMQNRNILVTIILILYYLVGSNYRIVIFALEYIHINRKLVLLKCIGDPYI